MYSLSISYNFNPIYNPYYYYADANGGYYGDPGWKIFFVGSQNDDQFQGDDAADTMWGNNGDDLLQGFGGDDDLYGGNGEDTLNGGIGDDDLFGGNNNDLFIGGAGYDAHYGGAGIDTVDYSSSVQHINMSLKHNLGFHGDSFGDSFYSIENVIGTKKADVIVGSDSLIGNTIDGGDGDDVIFGGGGDDLIVGGYGHDQMWGGDGADVFEWRIYGQNYVGADQIGDFDVEEDFLRFRVEVQEFIEVRTTETVYEGHTGLLVEVIEQYPNQNLPTIRYDVFLDNVTEQEFTTDQYELY